MKQYINTLELNHKHKPIPYGGTGDLREDGNANYGFKYVKGNQALLNKIPELTGDTALHALITAINMPHTGLFSVGCLSSLVTDENGFRHSGYVEFTINSISAIADAKNYFPLFFHFDCLLHEKEFLIPVTYSWELQPATFTKCDAIGFTCSIILNTHYKATQDEAWQAWTESLAIIGSFLGSVPSEYGDFIYSNEI